MFFFTIKMAENGRRWQAERRQLEMELEELRAKRDSMQHWETQVTYYFYFNILLPSNIINIYKY